MKIFKVLLAGLVLAMSFMGTLVYQESQSFSTPRSYVHLIRNEWGSGSAVMIAPGLALTAAHVANQENLVINGKPVKVLNIDESRDIALISVDLPCPCAPIGASPYPDEKVVAVGWSLGQLEYATEGRVQGFYEGFLYSTPLITFGNSGGGLFAFQDGQWKLVGITIRVSGASLGFFGVPVTHMVGSVSAETIWDFIHNKTMLCAESLGAPCPREVK